MELEDIWREWVNDHRETHRLQEECTLAIKLDVARLQERYKGWRLVITGLFGAVPGTVALIVMILK